LILGSLALELPKIMVINLLSDVSALNI
jgi:hypothetical protein